MRVAAAFRSFGLSKPRKEEKVRDSFLAISKIKHWPSDPVMVEISPKGEWEVIRVHLGSCESRMEFLQNCVVGRVGDLNSVVPDREIATVGSKTLGSPSGIKCFGSSNFKPIRNGWETRGQKKQTRVGPDLRDGTQQACNQERGRVSGNRGNVGRAESSGDCGKGKFVEGSKEAQASGSRPVVDLSNEAQSSKPQPSSRCGKDFVDMGGPAGRNEELALVIVVDSTGGDYQAERRIAEAPGVCNIH
ncbi:hypothetical protein F0562_023678 [Nyssa sinensis]|uniref:Uncharacterized protein n=1 Tax=Nyssa sinensis TaxID=561372 RepID=A0A5J5BHD5_9ASTE|nr:hypothetical protein F0562_023678 [Nyssa sinensis]